MRLAIIGTDTAVGKTTVAVALIELLKRQGRRVAAFKPVETGLQADRLRTLDRADADWLRLTRASGQELNALGIGFELPAAPLAASSAFSAADKLEKISWFHISGSEKSKS